MDHTTSVDHVPVTRIDIIKSDFSEHKIRTHPDVTWDYYRLTYWVKKDSKLLTWLRLTGVI